MSVKSAFLATVAMVIAMPVPALAEERRDIIVTARKREESILNVPVNETVILQEQLERFAVSDLYDLSSLVPNFIIGSQFHGALTSIRGVGTSTTNPGVDQSVALNIDGLQTSQGFSYNSAFFDAGQIEVLRGPQALFFGKNAPAGVIAIRTADPTDEFELIARLGYEFEAKAIQPELIISGPVGPGIRLRLAAQYHNSDSYFRNEPSMVGIGGRLPTSSKLERNENLLLRGTALFEPSSRYNARLKINFERFRKKGNNFGTMAKFCPDGVNSTIPGFQFMDPEDDCNISKIFRNVYFDPAFFPDIRNNGVPFDNRDRYYGTLEQNLEIIDGLTVTSVTGYFDLKRDSLLSVSGVTPTLASDHTWTQREFSQELRLTSDFANSPVNFMAGVFYQDGMMQQLNRTRFTTIFLPSGILSSGKNRIDTRTFSAFGQVIWDVLPTLEFAAGARWTDVKNVVSGITLLPIPAVGLQPGDRVPLTDPIHKSEDFSPEITLTYRPTDDLTIFAGYREGFKSGSFNIATFNAPNSSPGFDDERVSGFEGGIKARLFDRSLSVNLAVYDYDYKDLQVSATELLPGGGFISRTVNAASASATGVELDASFAPSGVPGLTLNGAVAYSDVRYDSFPNAPCGNGQTIAEGCDQLLNIATGRFTAQDLSGEQLVRAPKWSAAMGFNYEFPVSGSMMFSIGSNARYSGKYQTALINDPNYIQDSYWILDANVSLRDANNRWELSLIGNNLNDKIITPFCFNTNAQNGGVLGGLIAGGPVKGPAGSDEAFCMPNAGREVWLRLTVRLGELIR
jgi:iron complex outermembrane recepter protein